MSLKFSRIQFTPDLMPMDITGTDILQDTAWAAVRGSRFVRGPVFANPSWPTKIYLRLPKTQAAMLEVAMQEQKVTVVGKTFQLENRRSSYWRRRTRSNRQAPIRCR